MRKALALLIAVLAAPAVCHAGEFELTGYAGYTFPFYSQQFGYSPGPVSVDIPGVTVTVDQGGSFGLETSGGPAFAGGLAFFATDSFGFEVRYDNADVSVDVLDSVFNVRVGLPGGLQPVTADLEFTDGEAQLDGVAPWSVNLKLRTSGPVRFTVSGGASRLGDVGLRVEHTIGLGVTGFDLQANTMTIGTNPVSATAVAEGGSKWGGNLGVGLQFPLGERGALVLEGRGFYFGKRTIEWEPVIDRPLSAIEQSLLARTLENLPSVEFEPWWVQATIGVSFRF
jgi:hypothetical protein